MKSYRNGCICFVSSRDSICMDGTVYIIITGIIRNITVALDRTKLVRIKVKTDSKGSDQRLSGVDRMIWQELHLTKREVFRYP